MEFTQLSTVDSEPVAQLESTHKPHTPAYRQKHLVEVWQSSNLTQTDFCKQNKINNKTFARWLKKFNTKQVPPSSTVVKNTVIKSLSIEMQFSNGAVLRVTNAVDAVLSLMIKEALACKSN